jgi:hypothetical protein
MSLQCTLRVKLFTWLRLALLRLVVQPLPVLTSAARKQISRFGYSGLHNLRGNIILSVYRRALL